MITENKIEGLFVKRAVLLLLLLLFIPYSIQEKGVTRKSKREPAILYKDVRPLSSYYMSHLSKISLANGGNSAKTILHFKKLLKDYPKKYVDVLESYGDVISMGASYFSIAKMFYDTALAVSKRYQLDKEGLLLFKSTFNSKKLGSIRADFVYENLVKSVSSDYSDMPINGVIFSDVNSIYLKDNDLYKNEPNDSMLYNISKYIDSDSTKPIIFSVKPSNINHQEYQISSYKALAYFMMGMLMKENYENIEALSLFRKAKSLLEGKKTFASSYLGGKTVTQEISLCYSMGDYTTHYVMTELTYPEYLLYYILFCHQNKNHLIHKNDFDHLIQLYIKYSYKKSEMRFPVRKILDEASSNIVYGDISHFLNEVKLKHRKDIWKYIHMRERLLINKVIIEGMVQSQDFDLQYMERIVQKSTLISDSIDSMTSRFSPEGSNVYNILSDTYFHIAKAYLHYKQYENAKKYFLGIMDFQRSIDMHKYFFASYQAANIDAMHDSNIQSALDIIDSALREYKMLISRKMSISNVRSFSETHEITLLEMKFSLLHKLYKRDSSDYFIDNMLIAFSRIDTLLKKDFRHIDVVDPFYIDRIPKHKTYDYWRIYNSVIDIFFRNIDDNLLYQHITKNKGRRILKDITSSVVTRIDSSMLSMMDKIEQKIQYQYSILELKIQQAYKYSNQYLLSYTYTGNGNSMDDFHAFLKNIDNGVFSQNLFKRVNQTTPSYIKNEKIDSLLNMKRTQNNLIKLQEEKKASLEKMKDLYPKYYSLKYTNHEITPEKIQKKLKEDESIVEFFVSDKAVYSCIVSPDTIHITQNRDKPKVLEYTKYIYKFLSQPKLYSHIDSIQKYLTVNHYLISCTTLFHIFHSLLME